VRFSSFGDDLDYSGEHGTLLSFRGDGKGIRRARDGKFAGYGV
jgi:hypothetical protein